MRGVVHPNSLKPFRRFEMKISVIIPAYNAAQTIEKCLVSLINQTKPACEIIVADGGSTDSTIEKIQRFPDIILIHNERKHPGPGRNRGAETASGEILFFCDLDCVADKRVLEYHARAYKKRNDISGVMGTIGNASPKNNISNFVQKQFMVGDWILNLKTDGTVGSYLNGANFSIKRSIFTENWFSEDLVSYEDLDLLLRLKKKGIKIFYEPRAIVYHHHPTTLKQFLKRYIWYGEGLFQVYRTHGRETRKRFQNFSPERYLSFPINYLKEAVLNNNRLLCKDCIFDSFQHCKITCSQLLGKKIDSELDLHRIYCLGLAAGILKQRTSISYLDDQIEKLNTAE